MDTAGFEKYRDILRNNGISKEIEDVSENSPPELAGAGTTSKLLYVTIKFKDAAEKPLNLFVKVITSNESRTEMYETMKLFEKEVRFLTEYVPAVQNFCAAKGFSDLLNFYPKCYYGGSDMIVFENLVVDKGYILLSKQERQGLESARLALTTLAKHHAVSHAFINEIGGASVFFERFPNLNFEPFNEDVVKQMVEPLVENGIATNIKLLEKSNVPNKEEAINLLKKHKGKAYSILVGTLNSPSENEPLLTLNHGDYWNNNMLFLKNKDNGSFDGHVALDWQCVRYNSPALDIGNFMYTSMKPEVRRSHLSELLSHYFEVLESTASALGYPIGVTYDEFYTLYRKKIKYGFWFAIWLAVEVGYAVINDVGGDEGVEGFSVKFDNLVQRWIKENPEKSEKCARDLVELMHEYANVVLELHELA